MPRAPFRRAEAETGRGLNREGHIPGPEEKAGQMTPGAGRWTSHTTAQGLRVQEGWGTAGVGLAALDHLDSGHPCICSPSSARRGVERAAVICSPTSGSLLLRRAEGLEAVGSGPGDQQGPFHGSLIFPHCAHLPAGLLRPPTSSRPQCSPPLPPPAPGPPQEPLTQ